MLHKIYYKTMLLALLICICHWSQAATLAEFAFPDAKQTQVFRDLTEQLRCLVCQNESLAASQAELAKDLRKEIYAMMLAGKTQQQIIDFLVHRYGDFVLYNPPLKPSTYFLWYAPLLFFIIASWFLIRALMRHKKVLESEISQEEQLRIAAIIKPNPNP